MVRSIPAHDGMQTRPACNASSAKEYHVLLLLMHPLSTQNNSLSSTASQVGLGLVG